MKLTSEVIARDINCIIGRNNIFMYLAIFVSLSMVICFLFLLIKHLKGDKDEFYSKSNIISIGIMSLVCIGFIFCGPAMENDVLRSNIQNESWTVGRDVPVAKSRGPITDSEDFKIQYQDSGYVEVNSEEYRHREVGVADYIVTLGTGEQIIYSSKDYTYQGELKK